MAKSSDKRKLRIFIASPGDLREERSAFKKTLDDLNKGFGDGCNTEFIPLGWEDAFLPVDRRPQNEINKVIKSCDIFFLVLNRQKPKNSQWSSYTEEEFELARSLHNKRKRPTIYVFLKEIPRHIMAKNDRQLKLVLAFRRNLRKQNIVGRDFKNTDGFTKLLDSHLRAAARGTKPLQPSPLTSLIGTVEVEGLRREIRLLRKKLTPPKQSREAKKREPGHTTASASTPKTAALRRTKAELKILEIAERAAKAALDGRIEEARQDFARATNKTKDLRVLSLAFRFYYRIGDIDAAEDMAQHFSAIVGSEASMTGAAAVANLGMIAQARGNLSAAGKLHFKSLEINRKIGSLEGQASNLSNLGVIERRRGNLDAASKFLNQSLDICRELRDSEGITAALGNLSMVAQGRSNLNAAEKVSEGSIKD